ncbi:hypothetical protein OE09_1321 [Flavobacteriaceae bacterium MAR_2010_72]|nr:hypothetical protein OE09_1321 [Flavobacteriaceae bacterium MAR_2010_72]TVZ59948.1 hypothetical protein NA63_2491 [Flavobacteriaceae bacterium MAR_2010_105]
MKKAFLIISLVFIVNGYATNDQQTIDDLPKIGDVLVINEPSKQNYTHIDFPRLNFIVKRGGVANYDSVHGEHVVIKEIITKNDGTVYVQLEPKSGKKFFGFMKQVKANYEQAIKSGELSTL